MVEVFVPFMNHLPIYAVDTSSAEAPRGQRTQRSADPGPLGRPGGCGLPAGSSRGPTVRLGSLAVKDQRTAADAAGASRVQVQVQRDTGPTA